MHDIALINTVTNLAAEFDIRGIAWCVMRNYETFPRPRSDTSDFDLLLDSKPSVALEALRSVLQPPVCLGMVISRSGGEVISIYITLPGSPALRLDFMRKVSWAGCELLAASVVISNRHIVNDVPRPSPGHEVADSMMTYLFHRGRVKEEYRQHIQSTVQQNIAQFTACLAPVWGQKIAAELAERAIAADWAWFENWVHKTKRRLLLRASLSPFTALATLYEFGINTVHRVLHPPGVWIAFLGPDGAGKTTVGDAYRARMSTLYYTENQRQLHWRPNLLPAPGKLTGKNKGSYNVTEPHAKPPHGQMISLLRFSYFWFDYVIGHWFNVRPLLAKGGLITFDRYYHDFLVDARRYRLNLPKWLLSAAGRGVPQPELLFILDAPADVLYARKKELAPTEIAVQLNALRQLAVNNPSVRIIRVDRSVDAVVTALEIETIDYLNKRNRHQMDWPLLAGSVHA